MRSSASRGNRSFACTIGLVGALGVLSFLAVACRTSRIGGTYVAHGPNFVNLLQLTETNSGQITGALDTLELTADGKLNSENVSITGGALDGQQITLEMSGKNLAGTKTGDTIRLQSVQTNGDVWSEEFQRSSPAEFTNYADHLKFRANGIVLSENLGGPRSRTTPN
jgi:hypothetical protein